MDDLLVRALASERVEVVLEVEHSDGREEQHDDGDPEADDGNVAGPALPLEVAPQSTRLQVPEEHDDEGATEEEAPLPGQPGAGVDQPFVVRLDPQGRGQ